MTTVEFLLLVSAMYGSQMPSREAKGNIAICFAVAAVVVGLWEKFL